MIVFFMLSVISFIAAIMTFLAIAGMHMTTPVEIAWRSRSMVLCVVWAIMSALLLGGAAEFVL